MGLFSRKETNEDNEAVFDFRFPTSKKAVIIFTRFRLSFFRTISFVGVHFEMFSASEEKE